MVQNRFMELLARKGRIEDRRIPLVEAARKIGVSRQTVESWASNNVSRFDAFVINAMCDYFDCSIADLLILEEEEINPEFMPVA